MADLMTWIKIKLEDIMDIGACDDIAQHLVSMQAKSDVEEFLEEFLDKENQSHQEFLQELTRRWVQPNASGSFTVYRKESNSPNKETQKQRNIGSRKENKKAKSPEKSSSREEDANRKRSVGSGKKKTQFVPLFGGDGKIQACALLPGAFPNSSLVFPLPIFQCSQFKPCSFACRHVCECQATRHSLVGNCMGCGRVVCQQEGSGPCFYCSKLVVTGDEESVLNLGTKRSEKLMNSLMRKEGGGSESGGSSQLSGLSKAVRHRDQLLEYDRTTTRRTQVLDDQADYFTTDGNQWLSEAEKKSLRVREESLRDERFKSRRERKLVLDIAGREVSADQASIDVYNPNDRVVQQLQHCDRAADSDRQTPNLASRPEFPNLVNPTISSQPPKFVPSGKEGSHARKAHLGSLSGSSNLLRTRVQDNDQQLLRDDGKCLSMHQPWASLLVAGIKVHEGRTWCSSHRGRLWIAATATSPSSDAIEEMEEHYWQFHQKKSLNFPKSYPTSCLLGCVHVDDCLDQEEYSRKFSHKDSASPFVFICSNPQELVVKFPITGKHKIYKLDPEMHKCAIAGLRVTEE